MLTQKQRDLLAYIIKYHAEKGGITPSFEEMREALNLKSKSGVHRLMLTLEERGFIKRLTHRARSVEITRMPENIKDEEPLPVPSYLQNLHRAGGPTAAAASEAPPPEPSDPIAREIPMMGRIQAGTPLEAISHVDRQAAVPLDLLRDSGEHYALQINGRSMIGAGINEGDVVIIRDQAYANDGDIVVAVIDNEATLKRWKYKSKTEVELKAESPEFESRVCKTKDVSVRGKLVGLIRAY